MSKPTQQYIVERVVAVSVAINTLALSTLVYFVMDLSRTMSTVRVSLAENQATQRTIVNRMDRIENKVDQLQHLGAK